MQIVFNGKSITLTAPCNLFELLNDETVTKKSSLDQVVVAVNQTFIHRQDYQVCEIQDGDLIEMLGAVVGG